MSINSLNNFGTPTLSGDRVVSLQPILTHKYRVTVFGMGNGGVAPQSFTRQIKSVTLPNFSSGETTIYNYVSAVYMATRGEWSAGSFTFIDDITNGVRELIEAQFARQQNMHDQTSARSGSNYKFNMDVDILAGGATAGGSAEDPNILRKYCYSGCFLTSLDDGTMDYESANVKNIVCGFRYDNVVMFGSSGIRMASGISHTPEIQTQTGTEVLGIGSGAGLTVSTDKISVNVSGGVSIGGATLSGSLSF